MKGIGIDLWSPSLVIHPDLGQEAGPYTHVTMISFPAKLTYIHLLGLLGWLNENICQKYLMQYYLTVFINNVFH